MYFMRANIVQILCNNQSINNFTNNKHHQREFRQFCVICVKLCQAVFVIP